MAGFGPEEGESISPDGGGELLPLRIGFW